MNWDRLNLHIENLIPGIVILTACLSYLSIEFEAIQNNEVLKVLAFISAAYMAGAIGNVIGYFLIGYVSQQSLRPIMLLFFAPNGFKNLENPSHKEINIRFSEVIDIGESCDNPIIEKEVVKRRQTGGILRSAFIPFCVIIIVIGKSEHLLAVIQWILVILCYVILQFLYGIAQVRVFKEGLRGERVLLRNK